MKICHYYIILILFLNHCLGMEENISNIQKNYFSQLKTIIINHKIGCIATISVILTLSSLYKVKEIIQNNKILFTCMILSNIYLIYLLYKNPYIKVDKSIKNSANQKEFDRYQEYNQLIKNVILENNSTELFLYHKYVWHLNSNNDNNEDFFLNKILNKKENLNKLESLYYPYPEFTQFLLLDYCFKNNLIQAKEDINQLNLINILEKTTNQDIDCFFINYSDKEKLTNSLKQNIEKLNSMK